jgi:hypothetical protein
MVDGQKFTERKILLRYGTPADMQNAEGWQLLSSLLTGNFHACPQPISSARPESSSVIDLGLDCTDRF